LHQSAEWTAYIAQTIAEAGRTVPQDSAENKQFAAQVSAAVDHALTYVAPHMAALDEPYLIAAYALAALESGHQPPATAALKRLGQLEHREGNTSYWSLEMNTPFYGSGLTGRLETTALVVEALEKGEFVNGRDPSSTDLISRGMLFLLQHQDEYGVWYSSQATVNVLRAMVTATGLEPAIESSRAAAPKTETANILIDGKPVASVSLPVGNKISSPVVADLSAYLSAGTHQVELRRPSGASPASVQLLTDYYVPWTHTNVASDIHHEAGTSDALRLAVHFDKVSAKPGDDVRATWTRRESVFAGMA
jgi:hypothetical protein